MNYKHIFSSDYQREAFAGVINDIFTDKFERLKDVESIKADKNLAKDACRIGKIITSDKCEIAVYEVRLQDGVQLSRNRVAIRNLLRNSWKDYDGAFIAGYQDKNPEWRFSFLSETKELGADGYLEKRVTQAKRYTYLLGGDNVHRTAVERFCKLKDSKKELKDIIDAFSVEALSDEFFKAYKEQYIGFCDFIYENKNNTALFGAEFATWSDKTVRDYVKKMLGRLVFLCFLQKKGWLGVAADKEWGSGDHNFLQSLFTKASDKQKTDFLDEVLEPLFFNCLNEKRIDDIFDTMVANIGKVKIPYLNGGLFEKDEIDRPKSRFLEEMFGGLFEFFARYNFTIDENDPQDAEVGVDPEMLGKIFENLLEDNKDKGAFYTPKEIVQYMCRESLIAYLKTACLDADENEIRDFISTHDAKLFDDKEKKMLLKALKDVKICDPAIGSGAFPMGLLSELVACRLALRNCDDLAMLKREIIENNIYGVDIEKGAIDIARLRFWLAIVVDADYPAPLPNFDYKFMQGNSLLESYKGFDLSLLTKTKTEQSGGFQISLFDDSLDVLRKELKSIIDRYFNCVDYGQKERLRSDIRRNVLKQMKENHVNIDLSNIDLSANNRFFLWHTWFADVFNRPSGCNGFDIVIGNPPYIDSENMTAQGLSKERGILQEQYKYLSGNWDIYMAFMEKGIALSQIAVFITPDKWLSKPFGLKFRESCMRPKLKLITHAGSKVFKSATIDAIITLFENSNKNLTVSKFETMDKITKVSETDISQMSNPFLIDFLFSENSRIIQKLDLCKNAISDFAECENACATHDAYVLAELIENKENLNSLEYYKLVNTGTVAKYVSKWGKKEITYLGSKITFPVIQKNLFKKKLGRTYVNRVKRSKIIMKGLNLLDVCLDENAEFIPGKSTMVICSENINLLKFLMGVLNSKLTSFYIKTKYASSSYCGSISFTKNMINEFPVPQMDTKRQAAIIMLVEKILSEKRGNPMADTAHMERKIDLLVYKLYGINEAEQTIIER